MMRAGICGGACSDFGSWATTMDACQPTICSGKGLRNHQAGVILPATWQEVCRPQPLPGLLSSLRPQTLDHNLNTMQRRLAFFRPGQAWACTPLAPILVNGPHSKHNASQLPSTAWDISSANGYRSHTSNKLPSCH